MRIEISKLLLSIVLLLMGAVGLASPEMSEKNKELLLLDSELSDLYQRGPFLVYDCVNKHWVCTASNEFKRCEGGRVKAIEDKKAKMPCVPVKDFKTEASCITQQKYVTNSGMSSVSCIHPEIKLRKMAY